MEQTIENLKKHDLWSKRIKEDCKAKDAFLAIRKNRIDLYHKGGKLFGFDNDGFKTHLKYASVITVKEKEDYLTEKQLGEYKLASEFETSYTRIKENCSNYSGPEDAGISTIYHKHSYLSDSNVVVLDIEVSLKSLNENKSQDRIDILLFKKNSKTLQFVEAKHYSNSEIWSESIPKVIGQIKRYELQVAEKKEQLLSKYSEYVKTLNSLFEITPALPLPVDIEDKVTLLIFGFDEDQRNGRLKSLITQNPNHTFSGIKLYPIGNIEKVVTENLWNASVCK